MCSNVAPVTYQAEQGRQAGQGTCGAARFTPHGEEWHEACQANQAFQADEECQADVDKEASEDSVVFEAS